MAQPSLKLGKNLHLRLVFARFSKLVTAVLVLVVLGSGYYFILEPKYQVAGKASRENLTLAQTEFKKRQDYSNELKLLVENYHRINPAEIEKMKLILPQGKDIPGLLVQFQALAAKNGLLLASINFNDTGPVETKTEIKKVSINLDLVGGNQNSYAEVRDFIADVESNARLLDIESIFFAPDSPTYSFNIFAYYY